MDKIGTVLYNWIWKLLYCYCSCGGELKQGGRVLVIRGVLVFKWIYCGGSRWCVVQKLDEMKSGESFSPTTTVGLNLVQDDTLNNE